ncbi:tetratricopeptide repeat protein 31 isoform X1 [Rhineura floridana]|uniref:tetratricopeptide repeat protein 31 isoform X1 n=1 Tax=Rhineura floridana TaxID=261503 RepID=UPI002AC860BE|nr:tetratricopeptide repeat protein 31 isoform X1 [Rhineura floridana]
MPHPRSGEGRPRDAAAAAALAGRREAGRAGEGRGDDDPASPLPAGLSLPNSPAGPPGGVLGGGLGTLGLVAPRLLASWDDSAANQEQRRRQIMEQLEEEEAAEEEAYARHRAYVEMGQKCPDMDGEPCWYCDDEASEDYSYEDWEGYEEPEEEKAQNGGSATFCGFKKSFLCKPSVPASSAPSNQDCPLLGISLPQKQQLTAEEAERNAEELVATEERLKKKAEKKRMKKRRQKDRKRQEKRDQELKEKSKAQVDKSSHSSGLQDPDCLAAMPSALGSAPPDSEEGSTQDPSENLTSPGRSPSRSLEEETDEELDLSSTFVSKARLKVGCKPLPPPLPPLRKEKTARPERKELASKGQQQVPRSGLQMTAVEQSMVLADCGNETAKQGGYQEAVLLFTEAVKLNPREYRFFGNRSFCYERLQCYPKALCDAQLALSLQPGWPKGLFRKGKALMGLKRYVEAARTFEELLQFDGFRGDAAIQLEKCRVQLLLENGFSHYPPEWNILAREAQRSVAGEQQGGRPLASSNSQTAAGRLVSATITNSLGKALLASAAQIPVREWFAVWVGNLTPNITQEVLLRCFQPFGPIDSIRCLPRRFCAFVNYTRKEAAEAAYAALQGVEVEGSKLVLQLKHPVHATPPPAKVPSGIQQQPLKWEALQAPSAFLGSSWLHGLGHLPQ